MAKQKKSEDLSVARNVLDLAVGFVTTVEEAGGTIEDARRAIFKDEILKKRIGLLVMGKLKLEGFPCQKNVPHLIPDWVTEVVEDVEPTIVEGAKLSFPGFLRDEETYIDGPTVRKRAVEMVANKGLSDVPALLGPDGKGLKIIPAELRGEVYIVLTGTVLRDSGGGLYVPYLFWGGFEWYLFFRGLDRVWLDYVRLVSCE